MKKILTILIVLSFSVDRSLSQNYIIPRFVNLDKYEVLDTASLKYTYKLTHVSDSLNVNKTKKTDIQILLIGKRMSKYFSQYMVDYCLFAKKNMKDGWVSNNSEGGTYGYEIFKNYPDKKMTVTDLGSQVGTNEVGSNYQYEDDFNTQKWEIKSDTVTILSHRCKKATTTFRGRFYEAWFTTDIPTNNGPWKFGGLPGLILKVSDKNQNYVFECIGIERPKQVEYIKFWNLKYIKIKRVDLGKLYQRRLDDNVAYALLNGLQGAYEVCPDGSMKEIKHSKKEPFNPIELE